MLIVVVKLFTLILLTKTDSSSGTECSANWFDCGNGKCISEIWHCDGDNDCGNLKDEENCENPEKQNECLSSQFECASDKHCIPERWHCDGEKDCDDGSDEVRCDNVTEKCTGFLCRNHHCIPAKWHCDGNKDCTDGSDEEFCSPDKLCSDLEFLCSSGSCINQTLVCDTHKDCVDGSDEGLHCGDPCENATCSQKCRPTPEGPECYCNGGYILDARDNKTCSDIDECQQEGFCSHECTNTAGSYNCSCKNGYELVNRTCKAKGADPLLVFTTLHEIRAMYLRSQEYFLIRRAFAKASAVDVCPKNKRVYWLEISNKSSIYSAKTDGSDFRTVLGDGLMVPEDIAVDYIAGNLYITDSGLKQVLVCKIDGSMCSVLHDENVGKPRSIVLDHAEGVVDFGIYGSTDGTARQLAHRRQDWGSHRNDYPQYRFVYWSDWGEHTAGIYRSGMDGSHRIPLVSSDIAWPNGIALDRSTSRMYWADAKLNRIEYISLNGNSRKVIYNETVFHPYAVTVFEDTIYWSDWSAFSLESCNKFTGHDVKLLVRENGVHIMGVHVYHPLLMATVSNPCWSSECSHMCLISPVSGFRCACSYGFQLGKDGKTCIIEERSESLFVSEGSSIFYIIPKAVGSGAITEIPLQMHTTISRVSYDRNLHCLFVADTDTPAIHAVNMSSLHTRVLVKNHLVLPQDLAFDSRSNNLYWVDSRKGTVEVISIDSLKRVVLIENLNRPISLAISPANGIMFIATIGMHPSVIKCGMDGNNRIVLHSVNGMPVSLAVHPSKTTLYWADPSSGTISSTDYNNLRFPRILVRGAYGAMSVAASEEYIYWTTTRRELNMRKANVTHVLQLPGQGKASLIKRVTYSPATLPVGKSECLIGNGGCSYLCLTSPRGRTCACPSELMLDHDNVSCVARRCEANDFKCVNGQCIPPGLRCDGRKDCDDGSDEIDCGNRCSGDDFQCKNGRCILRSWRCDKRNDCVDNSDEEDCPPSAACVKDTIACLNGECVPVLWRCDGEKDCADGSDELNCNVTLCNSKDHYRCETGRCIPISWVCDGAEDCHDNSDEKNCSKSCTSHEFTCESDGSCIDEMLKCDGRADCIDSSDEKNCPHLHKNCQRDMYRCKDGSCIYDYEVCDGHSDCKGEEDEQNCTGNFKRMTTNLSMGVMASRFCVRQPCSRGGLSTCVKNCLEHQDCPTSNTMCQPEELLCSESKRCISKKWICDGDPDCSDESDEENCDQSRTTQKPKQTLPLEDSTCDAFYCYLSGQCIPWEKVCDGRQDCDDSSDEGEQCSKACRNNGGCSQICRKMPYGPKCFCLEGYTLLADNKTCGDINECDILGTCSHFCNNTKGSFKCSCAEGYVLHDHNRCKADGSATLVYLLGNAIRGFDLHSRSKHVIVNATNDDTDGMDYDALSEVFFWTEKYDETINLYSPRTGKRDAIVRSALRPAYIRYDWIAENLYLKDVSSAILACTKNLSYCKTLIKPSTTQINSIDIAPNTGLMFWTVWANEKRSQYSGLIERAEMDGSHRQSIVSHKTNAPSAITVDRILNMIYWTDMKLNTLECADFHGFQRRQVVQSGMYHPMAISVFEDYVYWADWGTDRIIRCNKFTGQDCANITETNVKAEVLLIVHKAMQPQTVNRCNNNSCSQLCLLTRQGSVCACDDMDKNSCDVESELTQIITPMSVVKCPKDYCNGVGECIVGDGEYICKCSPPYYGKTCDVEAHAATTSSYSSSWIVAVVLGITITAVMLLSMFMCIRNRERLHKVGESVSVKFRNPKSGHDSRLVMDTDDGNVYDELVIEQDGDCKQARGYSEYTNSEAEENDLKKWPSYGRGFTSSTIGNFFRKLKLNATML